MCPERFEVDDEIYDPALALVKSGERDWVSFDDAGCAGFQAAKSCAPGSRCIELWRAGLRTEVVFEFGKGFKRTQMFSSGDGGFDSDQIEYVNDAGGWLAEEFVRRSDGGATRVKLQRISRGAQRVTREQWIDGGWLMISDQNEPLSHFDRDTPWP